MFRLSRLYASLGAAVVGIGLLAGPAAATHSWGGYHWARTANPFTLSLGDNVGTAWDFYLRTTSTDWSKSSVLDTRVVTGAGGLRGSLFKQCNPVAGRVEVCNAAYGSNGWLGIASIWASGTHITQGTVKLNDTYFITPGYNKPAWRNLVMCQEVAHTLGLDHQDERFDNPNLNTCMDYTNLPDSNQHPNAHDYDQLVTTYSHLDTVSTVGASAATARSELGNTAADWGTALRTGQDGRPSLFVKNLANNQKVFTFVTWA